MPKQHACIFMHVLRRPDIEHLHRSIHAYPNRPPACVLVGSWIDRGLELTDPPTHCNQAGRERTFIACVLFLQVCRFDRLLVDWHGIMESSIDHRPDG